MQMLLMDDQSKTSTQMTEEQNSSLFSFLDLYMSSKTIHTKAPFSSRAQYISCIVIALTSVPSKRDCDFGVLVMITL